MTGKASLTRRAKEHLYHVSSWVIPADVVVGSNSATPDWASARSTTGAGFRPASRVISSSETP